MPDRDEAERKVSGIPPGSSGGRSGSRGGGIPTGSSIRRGGSGGSSGIPTGSNIRRRKRKGGGIPTGSAIRRGSGGGSRGIPPGSKDAEDLLDDEQKIRGTSMTNHGWQTWKGPQGIPNGARISKRRRRRGAGIPAGSRIQRPDTGLRKDAAVTVERKDAAGPVEVVDDAKGIVEAFVSVTGVKDNVDDVIEPGAYEKTLQERTPKGVWSHAWEHPVSKTLAIKEIMPGDPSLPDTLADGTKWPAEAGALWVKTQFNLDSDRGREAYSMVKFFGDDGSWSIGYRVPKNGATKNEKTGVRHIKTLNLYEYSPVLHGAAPLAKTRSVKSLDEAMAALEDAGYDTDGLEIEDAKADVDFDGLDRDEIKALRTAYEIVGAYLDEIDGKASPVTGDPDLADPYTEQGWAPGELVDELAAVLDPADYAELLEYAAAFDDAYAEGDDDAADVAIDEFMDILDAEIAADPEMAGLSELIGSVLDDRYPDVDPADFDDDEFVDEDDEYEDDDEGADDEYEEYDDDGSDEADDAPEPVGDTGVTAGQEPAAAPAGNAGSGGDGKAAPRVQVKTLADIDDIADSVLGAINFGEK